MMESDGHSWPLGVVMVLFNVVVRRGQWRCKSSILPVRRDLDEMKWEMEPPTVGEMKIKERGTAA